VPGGAEVVAFAEFGFRDHRDPTVGFTAQANCSWIGTAIPVYGAHGAAEGSFAVAYVAKAPVALLGERSQNIDRVGGDEGESGAVLEFGDDTVKAIGPESAVRAVAAHIADEDEIVLPRKEVQDADDTLGGVKFKVGDLDAGLRATELGQTLLAREDLLLEGGNFFRCGHPLSLTRLLLFWVSHGRIDAEGAIRADYLVVRTGRNEHHIAGL
jgi:hypothetical protein